MRWAVLLTLSLLGCSATGLDGQVYRGDGFAFRFAAPADGWRRIDATSAPLAYRHDGHAATMMVNARCGEDGPDVPLVALHNHLFLTFTEREVQSQEVVPFDDREALHTVLTAKLDGVPMHYDVWVLKKDGCVYDLLLMAPAQTFDQARGDFQAVVRGFATVDSHAD
jgi:hypothetical protein